jgi:hypothetical protein
MPRRRAARLLGSALVVASVPGVTARRARAADPPPPCSTGGKFCGNVNPLGKVGYNIGCCLGGPNETRTVCCPGIPGVVGSLCCPTGYLCGNTKAFCNDCCTCTSKVVCGGKCCKKGEYCQFNLLGSNFCEKRCPNGDEKCIGNCCTRNEECGFFTPCVRIRVRWHGIASAQEDPGDRARQTHFCNMFNMMGQPFGAGIAVAGSDVRRSSSRAQRRSTRPAPARSTDSAAAMLAIRDGSATRLRQKVTDAGRAASPADVVLNGSSCRASSLLVAEAERTR